MLYLPTYTVQSVHGLQQTFQVSANGMVDTGGLFVMNSTTTTPEVEGDPPCDPTGATQAQPSDARPPQAR